MARKRKVLSVSELERMLARAKKEMGRLQKERAKVVARLDQIDGRLAELGVQKRGRPARSKRGPAERKKAAKPVTPAKGKKRGRKKMTLAQHVAKILAGAKEPMSPQDIGKILRAKGVSKAKSLTVQIGQVLSSDKVSVRKIGRGKYVAAK